jgi:hypothetical protein
MSETESFKTPETDEHGYDQLDRHLADDRDAPEYGLPSSHGESSESANKSAHGKIETTRGEQIEELRPFTL